MTSTDYQNAVNSVIAETSGQRVGFTDGRYHGECTAVIERLFRKLGLPVPGMYGARGDGWGVQFPGELAPYFTHEHFQPGKAYPFGTILMWNSPHIAIVRSHSGNNEATVYQQNADPNGAACETFNRQLNNQWHTCTYALVPILHDAPIAPPAPLYTVEPINPHQVKVAAGKNKWNLAYDTFDHVATNPITTSDNNTIFTAVAVLHHSHIPQYNYYLENANTPHGWNVLDCGDYTPPPPSPPIVAPPAAPVPVKKPEKYTLLNTVMYFNTNGDAKMHNNPVSTISNGDYFIFGRNGKALNLSTDNMKDQQKWINTDDDVTPESPPKLQVLPPKITEVIQAAAKDIPVASVTPVQPVDTSVPPELTEDISWKKMTYLRADKKPVECTSTATKSIAIYDFASRRALGYLKPTTAFTGDKAILGTFEKRDNDGGWTKYARRVIDVENDLWPTLEGKYLVADIEDGDDFVYAERVKGWFDINWDNIQNGFTLAIKSSRTFIDGIMSKKEK